MKNLKILIIENEKNDIEVYLDSIKIFNEDHKDFQLVPTVKTTKEEGLEALTEEPWSAAFIDLKLSTGNILHAQEGNEIVREIYQKKRFPVYILTNTPQDVSSEFNRSLFLKVSSKDAINYSEVFDEIVKIQQTGILNILGKVGIIEKMLDEIFWNNLSSSLSEWFGVENAEKPLLRYALLHLLEFLDMTDEGKGFDNYNAIEAYIYPGIKKYPFTGDILANTVDKKTYVILTPACDLAPHGEAAMPKSDRVLIAEIESFKDNVLNSMINKFKKADNDTVKESEKDKIRRLISNNFADQFFYLPKSSFFPGGVVNFRRLQTVKLSDLKVYKKICNLNGQFTKDLIARFSFYYSRQGAPDFNFQMLVDGHLL